MKHLRLGLGVAALLVVVLVVASTVAADSSKPTLRLKASKTKCEVGTSVKFTVTVNASTAAYAVRLYKKYNGSWHFVTSASHVSGDTYVAYATAKPKGNRPFKAGYVNSAGTVTAYSNKVIVVVTK